MIEKNNFELNEGPQLFSLDLIRFRAGERTRNRRAGKLETSYSNHLPILSLPLSTSLYVAIFGESLDVCVAADPTWLTCLILVNPTYTR